MLPGELGKRYIARASFSGFALIAEEAVNYFWIMYHYRLQDGVVGVVHMAEKLSYQKETKPESVFSEQGFIQSRQPHLVVLRNRFTTSFAAFKNYAVA